jgi:hypothetical protein
MSSLVENFARNNMRRKMLEKASNTDIHTKVCEIALNNIYAPHVHTFIKCLNDREHFQPEKILGIKTRIVKSLDMYDTLKSNPKLNDEKIKIVIKSLNHEYLELFNAAEEHILNTLLFGDLTHCYVYDIASVLHRIQTTCSQEHEMLMDAKSRPRNESFVNDQTQLGLKVAKISNDIKDLIQEVSSVIDDKSFWVTNVRATFQLAKLELQAAFDTNSFALNDKGN